MQVCPYRPNSTPPMGSVTKLWEGHWQKVVLHQDIYMQVGMGSGAYKFIYHGSDEMYDRLLLVYKHVHNKLPMMGILIHTTMPTIMCSSTVVPSPTLPVVAVEYRYGATDNFLAALFYFKDEPGLVFIMFHSRLSPPLPGYVCSQININIHAFICSVKQKHTIIYKYIVYIYIYYLYYIYLYSVSSCFGSCVKSI